MSNLKVEGLKAGITSIKIKNDKATVKVSNLIKNITDSVVWKDTFKAGGGTSSKDISIEGGGENPANYFIIRVESGTLFYEFYLPIILYR